MTVASAIESPFVGAQPFDRKHARLFFGRAAEVRTLLSLIVSSRVVLLYAPSGAGKTSLLSAGVVPLLEREEQFEVLPITRVRGLAADDAPPSGIDNVYVYNALVRWASDRAAKREPLLAAAAVRGSQERSKEEGELVPSGSTLASFLEKRERLRDRRERPLPRAIVFDQFEELFTAYPELWEQREHFFRQVGAALADDPYLRVVLALREDYLAELLAYVDMRPPPFPDPVRFRLERLGRKAALEAVTKPLEETDRAFAPGVAEQLVDDLLTSRVSSESAQRREFRGEFVEPMHLQLACQSLWHEGATEITQRDLQRFGDVDQVLSKFYSDAVQAAAEAADLDEGYLRVWIEQKLITEGDTRNTVYRLRDNTAGIPNSAIEALERAGLIRRDARAGTDWYELTHDRFIKAIRASNREAQARTLGYGEDIDRTQPADQTLARASEARVNGRIEEAYQAASEAVHLYEEIGDQRGALNALVELASDCSLRGTFEEALEHLVRAQAIADSTGDMVGGAEVARLMAYGFLNLGRLDEALRKIEEAVAAFEHAGETEGALYALLDRAQLFDFTGLRDMAQAAFASVREKSRGIHDPYDRAVFLNRVGVTQQMRGGDMVAALSSYDAAADAFLEASSTGDAVAVLLQAASLAHDLEDYAACAQMCTRAVDLMPDYSEPWHRRAMAHWYAARYADAVSDFSHALDLGAIGAEVYSGRGQALAEWGHFEKAIEDLEQAIIHGAGETVAYARSGLGLALGGLGKFGAALQAFEMSLADEPENAWAYFNRAVTYERMADKRKAKTDYRRALKGDRPKLNPWRRAQARKRLGIEE